MVCVVVLLCLSVVFVSSRRRHTRCALVTGVQTCALPISPGFRNGVWNGCQRTESADSAQIVPQVPRWRHARAEAAYRFSAFFGVRENDRALLLLIAAT